MRSILIPGALAAGTIAAGLTSVPAQAATAECVGSNCVVVRHHYVPPHLVQQRPHYWQHTNWGSERSRNAREDARQEREFGGTGRW
jgi:hypothetical protein